MNVEGVKLTNSEMEYISFWTWDNVFVVIPWLSLKSVLINPDFVFSAFSKFVDDFKVYFFDRLKEVPDRYTINDMAEDTYEAMLKLWIQSCNIFWASQGWMISQCIAVNHPNFIKKMVLWSTTSKVQLNAFKIFSERIELAKQNEISELNKSFASNVYCKDTLKKYWDMILKSNLDVSKDEIRKFIILATSLLDFDVEDKLSNIKCETFVMWSNDDLIFWWESAVKLSEKLHCKLYLYDGYWHWVYDESPNFRDRVFDFLKS